MYIHITYTHSHPHHTQTMTPLQQTNMNNSIKYVNIEEEVRDKRKIELQVQRNFLNRQFPIYFVLFSFVKGGTVLSFSKELT
jgi:hypothetical protein